MGSMNTPSQPQQAASATNGIYCHRLGAFECYSLSDGGLNYPLESLFANVPLAQVAEALLRRGLPEEHVHTPYTCLFVNTGQHRVMIDMGAGNLSALAGRMFPHIDNTASATGTLLRNLEIAGFSPAGIDTVIITHAHPDHVGGALGNDDAFVFPNAACYIDAKEREFWLSDAAAATPAAAPMAPLARRMLQAMGERLRPVADGAEIVPGIRAVATYGHTPGHLALSITSQGQQLLHISDAVLYPLHLEHPDWKPAFDIQPAAADASLRMIADRAATEGALVFAHHFPPFPNLGRIVMAGTAWQWRPQL